MPVWVFIAIGSIFILDTIFASAISNPNMGVAFPAIAGMPLLLYGIFFDFWNVWFQTIWGCIFKWAVIFCYLAFFLLCLFCIGMMQATIKEEEKRLEKVSDLSAIIVLGAGLRDGHVSRLLRKRLDRAMEIARKYPRCILIVSGGLGRNQTITEAQAMENYLLQMSFPKGRIRKETQSKTTRQNFLFSQRVLRQTMQKEGKIAFVTSGFHVFRAKQLAFSLGMNAIGIAAPFAWYMAPNFYIRETMAIVKYVCNGTISWKDSWKKHPENRAE